MKKTNIDYYGTADNYIHLKFGDVRKRYNFTKEFIKEHKAFYDNYMLYVVDNGYSKFKCGYSIIKYIDTYKVPVHLYLNFSDKPITAKGAIRWWTKNNTITKELLELTLK